MNQTANGRLNDRKPRMGGLDLQVFDLETFLRYTLYARVASRVMIYCVHTFAELHPNPF